MRKIYLFLPMFLCAPAYATPFGDLMNNGVFPKYLVSAADAWWGVPVGNINAGAVSQKLSDAHTADIPLFQNAMTTIAYNESPLTISEISQHIDNTFYTIKNPLVARRGDKKSLILDTYGYGGFAQYDSDDNGDFEVDRWGASLDAKIYLTDGFAIGAGFARSMTNTDEELVYADIISNSFILFAQYLSAGGGFANAGVMVGATNWVTNKSIAGFTDDSDYTSLFYAAQVNVGVQIDTPAMFFTPQIGARYYQIKTDPHTDTAHQEFDEWSYDALAAIGEIRIGANIPSGDLVFRPSVVVGAGYDIMTGGDNEIGVTLINNSVYNIPVSVPDPLIFSTGLKFEIAMLGTFNAAIEYRLDMRQDFTSHNGLLNLSLLF